MRKTKVENGPSNPKVLRNLNPNNNIVFIGLVVSNVIVSNKNVLNYLKTTSNCEKKKLENGPSNLKKFLIKNFLKLLLKELAIKYI